MTPTPSSEVPPVPPKITPGGTYSLQTVCVGCKLYITRPDGSGGTEERLAEILSIREKQLGYFGQRRAEDTSQKPEDKWEFFVHWDQFNKRLDEWVTGSRLVLSRDLEWPTPKVAPPKKTPAARTVPSKTPRSKSLLRRATSNSVQPSSPAPSSSLADLDLSSFSPAPSLKRKYEEDEDKIDDLDADADGDADIDADGDMDIDAEGDPDTFDLTMGEPQSSSQEPQEPFSKEKEIEKLRVSGSMTQSVSEIARVKNLNRIQIGKYEVDAWYFSPYPREYAHIPVLYICEFCLSFFPSPLMIQRHRLKCNMSHPPGNEIYRHEDISFYEIDGKRQLTWCRNLGLLSKCFLDHKALYYDVTPFLYYVMAQRDSAGSHIIGYFSKEKECAEGYNVACILTLPQHQRHGYGRLLIQFSYELSKKEGKLGSPEKPLSDLGLLGYRAYWTETILDVIIDNLTEDISIDDIAHKTSITHADIMNTCTTLQLFKHIRGQNVIHLSEEVLERQEKIGNKRKRRIHAEYLKWKPPVFTRDQLRFGW